MSINLELPPELETRLRADAANRGVAIEALVLNTLQDRYEFPVSPNERRALVKSLRGKARGTHPTTEEFLAERSAEGRADI